MSPIRGIFVIWLLVSYRIILHFIVNVLIIFSICNVVAWLPQTKQKCVYTVLRNSLILVYMRLVKLVFFYIHVRKKNSPPIHHNISLESGDQDLICDMPVQWLEESATNPQGHCYRHCSGHLGVLSIWTSWHLGIIDHLHSTVYPCLSGCISWKKTARAVHRLLSFDRSRCPAQFSYDQGPETWNWSLTH